MTNQNTVPEPTPEHLGNVLIRRLRYGVAIVLTGILFSYIGYAFVAPPASMAGASLLLWPHSSAILATTVLAVLTILAVGISMALTHPDSPHTALFCAFIGMATLAITGGTIHMLLALGILTHQLPPLYRTLAKECVYWAILIAVGEACTRILYGRFFKNPSWLERHGLIAHTLHVGSPSLAELTGTTTDRSRPKAFALPAWLAGIGAFLITVALAVILLSIFMQSQAKGQVLFACLFSFGIAAFVAHYVLPNASTWAVFLAIPATAALGYLWANPTHVIYPGHAAFNLCRALPVDYVTAGLPGAVLGYYASVKLHLQQHAEANHE